MKFLITGGAGFIGSHVCDELLAQNHDVICIDNFITGSKKNIQLLEKHPRFQLVEHDCIKLLPKAIVADYILHLASPASPLKYYQYPVETFLVNTYGTYNLLEKAREWHAKFVFASTSEIYGDPSEHPQKETYWGNVNPIGARACYDEGKRGGETLISTYVSKYDLDGRIIRIFNTYGPRMDIRDGRVVTNFIGQILEQKPLTINGDGQQTRSFCYIEDLVKGIMAVVQSPDSKGEVYNIGNPYEITVYELAQILKDITGYHGELVYKDLPSDDPQRRQPDITKIQKELGWKPQISLHEGLTRTLSHFGFTI